MWKQEDQKNDKRDRVLSRAAKLTKWPKEVALLSYWSLWTVWRSRLITAVTHNELMCALVFRPRDWKRNNLWVTLAVIVIDVVVVMDGIRLWAAWRPWCWCARLSFRNLVWSVLRVLRVRCWQAFLDVSTQSTPSIKVCTSHHDQLSTKWLKTSWKRSAGDACVLFSQEQLFFPQRNTNLIIQRYCCCLF